MSLEEWKTQPRAAPEIQNSIARFQGQSLNRLGAQLLEEGDLCQVVKMRVATILLLEALDVQALFLLLSLSYSGFVDGVELAERMEAHKLGSGVSLFTGGVRGRVFLRSSP